MPIENFLLPDENLLYWSDFLVTYEEARYKMYITNLRLLLYSETGLVFKKENVITENFRQITGLQTIPRVIEVREVLAGDASVP